MNAHPAGAPAPGISDSDRSGLDPGARGAPRAAACAGAATRWTRGGIPQRPAARGKFLWAGDEKLFVRGVTYGTFSRNGDGHQYPPLAGRRRGLRAHGGERPERRAHLHLATALAARHGARTRTVGDGRARLGATRGLSREPSAGALDRGSGAVGRGRLCRPPRGPVLRRRQRDSDPGRAVGRPGPGREVRRAPARRRSAGGPGRAVHYVNYPSTEYLQSPASDLVRSTSTSRVPRNSRPIWPGFKTWPGTGRC